MATRLPNTRRNAIVDSMVDALDAGSGPGTVQIRAGSQPATADTAATGTVLATVVLGDPAFGSAATGSASANAIATVAAGQSGTAGWFRSLDSNGATVLDGSVTATGGGGDMELNNTSIASGQNVDITSWTVTMPAG